jgi:Flp pilus assembly pilin Flp
MNAQPSHFRALPRFSRLRRLRLAEDGSAAAEYALLLGLMGVAVLIAMLRLSGAVSDSIGANATVVAAADSGAHPAPERGFGGTQVSSVPATPRSWPEEEPRAKRPTSRPEAGEPIG